MKIKIIYLFVFLLLLDICLSQNLDITKNFKDDGRIEIIISSDESYNNIKILDPFPFCLNPIQISNSGKVQTTNEGMRFIEWDVDLNPGDNYFEYTFEKNYECGSITTLQPTRLYIETDMSISNSISLTQEQINSIKKNRCIVNDKCEYPIENYFECSEDCPSGGIDGICDELKDGMCDDDCIRQNKKNLDPDCLKKSKWIYVIIGTLILTLVLIAFFIFSRKK